MAGSDRALDAGRLGGCALDVTVGDALLAQDIDGLIDFRITDL